jgi:3-oxoacyl-[acyl-carrier-protein] synthase III
VREGVITEPIRIFAPGFGAGAVAGYAVMRIDPAVVAVQAPSAPEAEAEAPEQAIPAPRESSAASDDVREAFG